MTNRTTSQPRVGASVRSGVPDTEAGTNRTPNRTPDALTTLTAGHPAGQGQTGQPPRSRTGHLADLEATEDWDTCPLCQGDWLKCGCDPEEADAAFLPEETGETK